jgi:hypothetical protein
MLPCMDKLGGIVVPAYYTSSVNLPIAHGHVIIRDQVSLVAQTS